MLARILDYVAFVLISLVTFVVLPAQDPSVITRTLQASYLSAEVASSTSEFETAISAASVILSGRAVNCQGAQNCGVRLGLSGTLRFHKHSGIITTPNEIRLIRGATGTTLMFVNRIQKEACPDHANGVGRILGCANITYGGWILVVRDRTRMGGVLAHEFGHSQGLPHRNGPCALMYEFYAPEHQGLDSWECKQLRDPYNNRPRN